MVLVSGTTWHRVVAPAVDSNVPLIGVHEHINGDPSGG